MNILAIDTSCDDSCISVVGAEGGKVKVLSNIVSSQVKIHRKYGGVYPTLAKREHQKNLPLVLKKALNKAKNPKINLIAITIGPGLEPCLWVGVNFAKDLAQKWNLPIVPVNHIEAHIFANFIEKFQVSGFGFRGVFPAVCLVVSGGHTQLILMRKIGRYEIIGETRDDAAGECFDKTARILGLPYPGGPAIAEVALSSNSKIKNQKSKLQSKIQNLEIKLPRPMINSNSYDFSFSGLKTAVLYDFKKRPAKIQKSREYIREMAKEIQQAIIDVLIKKTIKAARDLKARSILLGGGVAANRELRQQFQENIEEKNLGFTFQVPGFRMCTDNAAMVGVTAYFHLQSRKSWRQIRARANLRV